MKPLKETAEFERLKFLHERRITLYNTRRDHEWKIFFGMIGLFVAADAVFISNGVSLGPHKWIWVTAIVGLAAAQLYHLFRLQDRNFYDRTAMEKINDTICQSLSLDKRNPMWERHRDGRLGWWTFVPQILVIVIVAGVSAGLPFIQIMKCKT
jgi:hypothetical protein